MTAWQNFLGGFGGKLDPTATSTHHRTQAALQFMHDAIKIAPTAVTG